MVQFKATAWPPFGRTIPFWERRKKERKKEVGASLGNQHLVQQSLTTFRDNVLLYRADLWLVQLLLMLLRNLVKVSDHLRKCSCCNLQISEILRGFVWEKVAATFSHTNPLTIPIFKLLPNFIFQWYRPQTWQFYLVFPALFISGTHNVPGLKFKGG